MYNQHNMQWQVDECMMEWVQRHKKDMYWIDRNAKDEW